jgi:hypothetical protein
MTKQYETTSCGYALKFTGPGTVEDFDKRAGKLGACLENSVIKILWHETLPEWQEAFAELLHERTGIARQTDEAATARVRARSKNPDNVTPLKERLRVYNERVYNEWVNGSEAKKQALQEWAQETANGIRIDPSVAAQPPAGPLKGDLAKANDILTHDSDYVETRVTKLLSKVQDFELTRDEDGKPDPQSLARLINRYVIADLNLN